MLEMLELWQNHFLHQPRSFTKLFLFLKGVSTFLSKISWKYLIKVLNEWSPKIELRLLKLFSKLQWLKTKLANRKAWKWKKGTEKILGCALGNLNLRGESLDGAYFFKCINLYSVPDGIKLRKAYNLGLTKHWKESYCSKIVLLMNIPRCTRDLICQRRTYLVYHFKFLSSWI